MERAIRMTMHNAVIVAHGSPGHPQSQDAAMAILAAGVSDVLPKWTIRGATLASPGSLESALHGLESPLIYPFFMSQGYFTGVVLPRRLIRAGCNHLQLPPFGADPAIPALVAEAAMTGARTANLVPEETALLLAAHGSKVSPASRLATLALIQRLLVALPFKAVVAGFIEEPPYLVGAAHDLGRALCLPLFTLTAGHVLDDVPDAMLRAGFTGPILPAIGSHLAVPRVIAAGLERYATKAAA